MSALLLECVFGHNTLEGTDILGNINRDNAASSSCYPELSQVIYVKNWSSWFLAIPVGLRLLMDG
ncbi:MAG: hypothetical protein WBE52_00995, partial [Terriglobales bacterium]